MMSVTSVRVARVELIFLEMTLHRLEKLLEKLLHFKACDTAH